MRDRPEAAMYFPVIDDYGKRVLWAKICKSNEANADDTSESNVRRVDPDAHAPTKCQHEHWDSQTDWESSTLRCSATTCPPTPACLSQLPRTSAAPDSEMKQPRPKKRRERPKKQSAISNNRTKGDEREGFA